MRCDTRSSARDEWYTVAPPHRVRSIDDISTDSRRLVRFGVFELDPLTVVLACVERNREARDA